MQRPWLFIFAIALMLVVLMWGQHAVLAPYSGGGTWGPGMMGSRYEGTEGYGPRGMGPRWGYPRQDLNLSTDDVKAYMERWITWQGNRRLQVGEVKEKDPGAITADIVTKENSLVQRFVVDRRNGVVQPTED